MKRIERIKIPIKEEMNVFEAKFYDYMSSKVFLLNRITHFIVKRKGKQMRPMFVFFSAKLNSRGLVTEKTYRGASVIELIHTATLVHDDIVDESNFRRGFFSINALWKNKIAVLVGDYLLSKGMLLCSTHEDSDLLKIISEAIREMSEGELLQIEKARLLNINEEDYFNIIKKKTASLIASCCKVGAVSVNATPGQIEAMYEFGLLIGIAFQIKDDLFDYTEGHIGKPRGIDIKEKKMTLPLIYVLNSVNNKQKKWLIKMIKRSNKDKNAIKSVIQFVIDNGGLEYAKNKMASYYQKALDILSRYEDSSYKDSLTDILSYVIDRKN